jgi:hypothetical protein
VTSASSTSLGTRREIPNYVSVNVVQEFSHTGISGQREGRGGKQGLGGRGRRKKERKDSNIQDLKGSMNLRHKIEKKNLGAE